MYIFILYDSSGQNISKSIQHKIKDKTPIRVRIRQENLVRSFFSPFARLVENLFFRIKHNTKILEIIWEDKQEYIQVYRSYFY